MTTESSALLTQVGSVVRYTVTVANTGNAPADDVIVLDLAPDEVHVLSVDLLDEVEAVQIGSREGKDDIVWVVGELEPGQSLELTWTGRATKAGDLRAANTVTATADGGLSASDDHSSFLATTEPAETTNPSFDPIVKRKVIFRAPPEDTTTSGALPFTGMDQWLYAGVGSALIVLGLTLMAAGRLRGAHRRVAVGVALLLLLTTCTTDSGDETPQVKGTRLERNESPGEEQDDGQQDDGDAEENGEQDPEQADEAGDEAAEADEAAGDATDAAPPAPAPAPPAPPVRDVRITTIELADLPISLLGSRTGDNEVRYQWDEAAGEFVTANSSRIHTPGQTVELLTEISDSGGSIEVHVRLLNIAERERLAVRGEIVHEVFDSGGRIATLVSDPINVVLDPGGETGASFFFALPSGSYSVLSSFEAD